MLPSPAGLLLHTNHFLDPRAAAGDTEPREAPDSLIRYEVLQRALHRHRDKVTTDAVRELLTSHERGTGSICCHPAADEASDQQYATLATVELDFAARTVEASAGPPCGHDFMPAGG
jgi:isopenicillin-N N-acyltransferase-like protein